MAGSDGCDEWRAALLDDAHRLPVVAVRAGRVAEANGAARELFAQLRVGMAVDELADESCRHKLRALLDKAALGNSTELEVVQDGHPPLRVEVLLLASRGEQLLLVVSRGDRYTDEIGARLMAANNDLANLTRELSRRTHELETTGQKMQKLADLRELFTAALAHDLRAPLSVILLSEASLRRKPAPVQETEFASHSDKIERSARRMSRMIDDLLLAATLDSSDSLNAHALESVKLDQLARDTVDDLRPLASAGRVRVVVTAPERIELFGHRGWLERVLANLLTNAVRHSPPGGRVDVKLAMGSSSVRCEVVDQGEGVPAAERERIFDRFVQRGDGRGEVGLGLYICRKVVTLHGGRIWAEDGPDGGAAFIFTIPPGQVPPAHP